MLPGEQRSLLTSLPSWQVRSVHLQCGVPAQPAQLSSPAAPWSFGALGGGSPCLGCWLQLVCVANRHSSDQIRTVWTQLCFQMSLVGTSWHRNICCRSPEGSAGSFQGLVSHHSWVPLQDTCLCPCTTDLVKRKCPQERPGLVLLTAFPAWICPVQVKTLADIPMDQGSKCPLAAAPSALLSGKLLFYRLG